jgi:hypothetical protein
MYMIFENHNSPFILSKNLPKMCQLLWLNTASSYIWFTSLNVEFNAHVTLIKAGLCDLQIINTFCIYYLQM